VRLQALAFGDLRRGVVGYYDLARDARVEARKAATDGERNLWRERLKDLGVRVGNALIEMGDLAATRRHLETLRSGADTDGDSILDSRLALLCLQLGDVGAAEQYTNAATSGEQAEEGVSVVLKPLLSMAEGRYEDAAAEWRALSEGEHAVLATQNLAVCLLYLGRIDEVGAFSFTFYLYHLGVS
jgi:HEAT repeat protein